MSKGILSYLFPTLIILSCVNFTWAWILTAVKAPKSPEEARNPRKVRQDWKYKENDRSDGLRISVAAEVKPTTKTAVSSSR